MTAEAYQPISIGSDEFRVPGLSMAGLRRALSLLAAAEELSGEIADDRRDKLLQVMIVAGFNPVPPATLQQAQRLASHRERLLASGAYTIEALAEVRGDSAESATRTWLSRRRKAHDLFTVSHDNATLVPAFQLDDSAEPLAGLKPVLRELQDAKLGDWGTWTWLTSASPWLAGAVPTEMLVRDADRVAAAARQFASNLAPTG